MAEHSGILVLHKSRCSSVSIQQLFEGLSRIGSAEPCHQSNIHLGRLGKDPEIPCLDERPAHEMELDHVLELLPHVRLVLRDPAANAHCEMLLRYRRPRRSSHEGIDAVCSDQYICLHFPIFRFDNPVAFSSNPGDLLPSVNTSVVNCGLKQVRIEPATKNDDSSIALVKPSLISLPIGH